MEGNPFERFHELPVDEWLAVLKRSLNEREIDGVEFPGFPDEELQNRVHGCSGEDGLDGVAAFYRICRGHYEPGGRLLDFGAGWGRITRAFLRDFPADGLYGFEPDWQLCLTARRLNPYVCYLHGPTRPQGTLPTDFFDVVVAYSVFSHLPEHSARTWLREIANALRVDGVAIVTAYGEEWLQAVERQAASGDLHPHIERLLSATSPEELRSHYDAGEFFAIGGDPDFRTATLIPPARMAGLVDGLGLSVVATETAALQNVFVLRRSS